MDGCGTGNGEAYPIRKQMYQSSNKRIIKNTLLLYVRMLFLVLISLYTSRIVLQTLGIEDYGINNVVAGIISFLGFLTGSLSGASSRFITFSLGKGDLIHLKKTFGNIIAIHLLFAVVILILGETIGLWFVSTQLNIPPEREVAAFWVYQFSILTAIGSIVSMPYNAVIIAHEKMSAFAYLTIGDAILKLGAVFLLIYLPYDKLILYALFILCIQLFDFIVYITYCRRKFEEIKSPGIKIDKPLFKEIFYYTGWTMNGNLAVFGYTQGLNILLNIFFNPAINAARGIAVQVQNIVNNFSINFQTAVNPQLTKSYAQEDYPRMHQLLISSSKFSVFLMFLICLPLSLEIDMVLKWWLGSYPAHSNSFLRLILITSILFCLANPIITSAHATGRIKRFQIIEGSMLLMIVPLSYVLLKYFNVPPESVFIVHILIELCTQYARIKIVLPMIEMKTNIYTKEVILPIGKVCISGAIIPVCLFLYLPQNTLMFFIIGIVCILSVTSCIYVFGCTERERNVITSKLRTTLKR